MVPGYAAFSAGQNMVTRSPLVTGHPVASVSAVGGNDAGGTQIARDQGVILKDDVACRLTHMDYHVVADATGGKGLLLKDKKRTKQVLSKAVKLSREGKPVLVNAWIGKTDFRKGSISI